MNQDNWIEIIRFLQPIDVLASLFTVNRNVHNLIRNLCICKDDICKFCCGHISNIKLYFGDYPIWDYVKIIGNTKYIIRLHLLKLAFQLGDLNPTMENKDCELFSKIVNQQELDLLDFYRSVFYSKQDNSEEESIDFLLIGDYRVGKSSFATYVKFGKLGNGGMTETDVFVKKFKISNEKSYEHRIWDTNGEEISRYKTVLIKQYMRSEMNVLLCFSMDHRVTLRNLDEWYEATLEFDIPALGVIVGSHPYDAQEKKAVVFLKDVMKKAYAYGRSVFVEVDVNNSKHVFVPFWFIHFQLTYFYKRKENNFTTTNLPNQISNEEENQANGCFCF